MFQISINSDKTKTKSRQKRITTSDYLEWQNVIFLMNELKKEKDISILMVVALGSYLGLRYSDMIRLTWNDIINKDVLIIEEQKTKKVKQITINPDLRAIVESIHQQKKSELIIVNKFGKPLSIQYINRRLKQIKYKYRLKIQNISVHSFRKSFGRRVYENNYRSEHALILLSDLFNHSSVAITRRYLGLRQEEIADVYLNL